MKIKKWETFNESIEDFRKLSKELDEEPLVWFHDHPKYKQYELEYVRNQHIKTICDSFGVDPNNIPDEMKELIDSTIELVISMNDLDSVDINDLDETYLKQHKEEIKRITDDILKMTLDKEDYEVSSKLKKYRDELDNY